MHTTAPDPHATLPASQRLGRAHAMPAVHATQRPIPSHTPPGHIDPAVVLPEFAHTAVPVMHEIAPVLHGLLGVHVAPAMHALQRPIPSQTPPGHIDPIG
jgi:hypothetical protein